LDYLDHIVLFIAALVANMFSAFAGGGAGLLQLPVLIFLGLPFGVALATHKVASVALGLGATIRHLRNRNLEAGFAAMLLLSGVPGVILGANIILKIPDRAAEFALGALTAALGVYSWHKKSFGQTHEPRHRSRSGYAVGSAVLFTIGILNGSLTSGTGLFVTVWLVSWYGLDYKRAVAYTLVLVGMFWNGAGALTLGLLGDIKWSWLPALLCGSLLGGYFGAHLAIVSSNRAIKRIFELITLLVGIKLMLG
jgi:uncharacterized membrane protein YfcA